MKVVCSYCRSSWAAEGPPDMVSHGICEGCFAFYERTWDGLSLGEYLDDFDEPVIVVSDEGRVLAVNEKMAEVLGRTDREARGLLGGEVMVCAYARLEGGCGQTVHCSACTIRRTVEAARDTGEAQENVLAYLERDDGPVHLRISTSRIDQGVRVVIHDMQPEGE